MSVGSISGCWLVEAESNLCLYELAAQLSAILQLENPIFYSYFKPCTFFSSRHRRHLLAVILASKS
jgi:hypothetical protein